jgi:hypothetical protein
MAQSISGTFTAEYWCGGELIWREQSTVYIVSNGINEILNINFDDLPETNQIPPRELP